MIPNWMQLRLRMSVNAAIDFRLLRIYVGRVDYSGTYHSYITHARRAKAPNCSGLIVCHGERRCERPSFSILANGLQSELPMRHT